MLYLLNELKSEVTWHWSRPLQHFVLLIEANPVELLVLTFLILSNPAVPRVDVSDCGLKGLILKGHDEVDCLLFNDDA